MHKTVTRVKMEICTINDQMSITAHISCLVVNCTIASYFIAPSFHGLKWYYYHDSCCFALKVNFCDKIFMNVPKFRELLVPSPLTPLFARCATSQVNFMKFFCNPRIIHKNHEIFRLGKFGAIQYSYLMAYCMWTE